MKKYILSGTPGSGKTSIIRMLEKLGNHVVEEAATHTIALQHANGIEKPWEKIEFIDDIINLQKQRQLFSSKVDNSMIFFDRSPVCTYALCRYLSFEPTDNLLKEISRVDEIYDKKVFFIENLGFIENTDARQITFDEALKFERYHIDAYQKFGYEIIKVPKAPIKIRSEIILESI